MPVLLRLRYMRAAVLLPASFIVVRAYRPFFTVADSAQLVCRQAEPGQIFFGLLGTRITERQVVFFRSPFIAIALDR